jgi:hypothetical protein
MDVLPLWVLTHAEKLKELRSVRIDLRRSLQMHRRLALGIAAAGVVLTAIYLCIFRSNGAAQSGHYAAVLLNAAVLLFASLALGVGAAVVAHSMDQGVYIGADVEELLGVVPMAQLPDFAEATDELVEESLRLLANGIVYACPEGSLRRCVLTGTGSGAGVTTIALRTREKLKAMGRPATLVDGEGTPHAENGAEKAADESGSQCDSLILTDTAPLAKSPDTEFLARFADCVVVVVESGVTTRAQLRDAANCLQKLNLGAVGFVLNRVKLAHADAEFRNTVETAHLAAEGEAANPTRQFADAVQRALAEPPKRSPVTPATRLRSAASPAKFKDEHKPTTALTITKKTTQPSAWDAPGVPPWLADALTRIEEEQVRQMDAQQPEKTGEGNGQTALFGTEIYETPKAEEGQVTFEERAGGNASPMNESGDMLFEMEANEPPEHPDSATPTQPGTPLVTKPSRLSGLRGLVTAADLKELSQVRAVEKGSSETKSSGLPPALIDALNEAPARLNSLRGLVTPEDLKDLNLARIPLAASASGNAQETPVGERQPTSQDEARSAMRAEPQTFIPFPEPEQAASTAEPRSALEEKIVPQSEGAPAKTPTTSRRERRANYGEVQILPSKRGQYRRKK